MTEPKEEKKLTPPYLSFKTFMNFLEKLKVGIPSRIDRSVMGTFSGAAQAQLFPALRYLHLINPDDTPTDKLTRLVTLEGPEKQKLFKEMIVGAYPFLFKDGIDLKRMTASHLQELFDKAGASGATTRKSIAFFMAAAKHVGIELSPHLKIRGAVRTPRKGKKTKTEKGDVHGAEHNENELPPLVETKTWQQILSEKFPQFDPNWTPEAQTKWIDAFKELMGELKKQDEKEESQ